MRLSRHTLDDASRTTQDIRKQVSVNGRGESKRQKGKRHRRHRFRDALSSVVIYECRSSEQHVASPRTCRREAADGRHTKRKEVYVLMNGFRLEPKQPMEESELGQSYGKRL